MPRRAAERILVVEDIAINRTIAAALLQKVGFSALTANDGEAALAAHSRDPVALVLMDVQMPVMDGLTATREIRAKPHLRGLPVIAMTAHPTVEDQRQTAGLLLHMNRPTFYLRSLHDFRRDFASSTRHLGEALIVGQWPEARRLAHSLKSVAGSLGAHRLSEAARRLENLLASGNADLAALEETEAALGEVLDGLIHLPALPAEAPAEISDTPQLLTMIEELANLLDHGDARSGGAWRSLQYAAPAEHQEALGEIEWLIEDIEYGAVRDLPGQWRARRAPSAQNTEP